MSYVGFYRFKVGSVDSVSSEVKFTKNFIHAKTVTIQPVILCEGKRILKYADKNGQYRFYPFTKYYEDALQPKEIGKISNLIVSILNSQTSAKSVGYKSDRTVRLTSEPIDDATLLMLSDIYTSPRVYLYVGTTTDLSSDWILVTVKASKPVRKNAKDGFFVMELELTLPDYYSITML